MTNIVAHFNQWCKRDNYLRECDRWAAKETLAAFCWASTSLQLLGKDGQDNRQCSTIKLHILTKYAVNHAEKGKVFISLKSKCVQAFNQVFVKHL